MVRTSAGRARKSDFGKLLMRFNKRIFKLDDGRRVRFRAEGKGDNRKYIFEIV
ncbi:MAG TPA: hypothetical protein VHT01_06620 [Candidatus Udaeobacter sp.]|jgi:hypothetical protein|nr:hypothetical protein [Candidatus Udaeobacter sp.]